MIKEYCVFFSEFIHKDINLCIAAGKFIDDFKQAEVRPLYKKDGRTDKSNYRPISILSNVSKVYERSLYNQLYDFFDKNIFSKYQCGFRKGATVLTDLSKAFESIFHDLLVARLNAHGLKRNALKLVYD